MSNADSRASDDLQHKLVEEMKSSRIEEPASIDDIVQSTDIDNRDEAKDVLRSLINDGKISTTPDWEYKLASRLRR